LASQPPDASGTASSEAALGPPVAPSLSYRLQFILLVGALRLLGALPRAWALRLGAAAGDLLYWVHAGGRRVALLNLAIAFPEKSEGERTRILRASLRNLGRMVAEFCHLPNLTAANCIDYVSFADRAGWEYALARAAERGAVIVTGHFGNWEMLAYVHALLGHPITLVHRPMRNPLVGEIIDSIRTLPGTQAIKKKEAARAALRVLRQKGIVVIPSDQNQTHSYGVFVDFFGKPACTTAGAARLAALTGAIVAPVFLVREGETERHRVELLPDIEMVDTGDRAADAITNTQRCSDAIEAMIRRYPEQWIWFHKRWKTRPNGEAPVY